MASPADIVTYIGIPLAVLGVSPILYNFIIAFFIKLRLKRQLKALGLLEDTVIRSRLMNGVVELELPVYDLELEGCPNIRTHFRGDYWEGNKIVRGVQGGSWTKFQYGIGDKKEPHLERYLAGSVSKEFQISSKLSLPEASARFEDLLGHFLQIVMGHFHQGEWKSGAYLHAEGFKALKFHNSDVPVDTTLLRGVIVFPLYQLLELKTARSSLENRGSLSLTFHTRTTTNITDHQINLEPPNDADYFSQLEIKKFVGPSPEPWDEAWIVKGTNRYFIQEPSASAQENSAARKVANDAENRISMLAKVGKPQEGGKLSANIQIEAVHPKGRGMALQNTEKDTLDGNDPHQLAQAEEKTSIADVDVPRTTPVKAAPEAVENAKADAFIEHSGATLVSDPPSTLSASGEKSAVGSKLRIDSSDQDTKPSRKVTLEQNIFAGQNSFSEDGMQSSTTLDHGKIARTSKQDSHVHPEAVVPKKGIYIWISSAGISQIFGINGLGSNHNLVRLKEIDTVYHIMEPVEGLGKSIQLPKPILESNFLMHAFAAHLELQNSSKLPKFEYQAEVLYKTIFSFISLQLAERFTGDFNPPFGMIVPRGPPSSPHTAPDTEKPLSRERVRELESTIHAKVVDIKKEREANLLYEDVKYLERWRSNKLSLLRKRISPHLFRHEQEAMGCRYVQLSELRRHLDLSLWNAAYSRLNLPHLKGSLSHSRVPTIREILYGILKDEAFAFQVVDCLGAIEREMDTAHKDVKLDEKIRVQNNPISFFCAIVLIDEVAKNAEKFMLTDDIQQCLKRSERVYIQ